VLIEEVVSFLQEAKMAIATKLNKITFFIFIFIYLSANLKKLLSIKKNYFLERKTKKVNLQSNIKIHHGKNI
jgi:peptidoglycan biosynthesis protein MviN/MurJ (putative lipid II flippase)